MATSTPSPLGHLPMPPQPRRPEIDNRTMKLLVGVIAIALPLLTDVLTGCRILSISESYYETGPASVIFVGSLFAIAAFLLAYNGRTRLQMVLSKVGGLAAALIALFPCDCGHIDGPGVHYAAAAVLFVILAFFCHAFYKRSFKFTYPQAKVRRLVYLVCFVAIVGAILALVVHRIRHGHTPDPSRFVFYGEATALLAFGISWLTASRTVPGLTHPEERFRPLRSEIRRTDGGAERRTRRRRARTSAVARRQDGTEGPTRSAAHRRSRPHGSSRPRPRGSCAGSS